jgi:cytoskeletal protein RodZ
MDKNFCHKIDQESLVEQYVAGKLRGELLDEFEQHIKECEDHAQAVLLEKALKRGISEFARGEIKTRLRDKLRKREDTRYMILRYAAILLVAVITPLILYYQFNVAPEEMAKSVTKLEQKKEVEEADEATPDTPGESVQSESGPAKIVSKQKSIQPPVPAAPSEPASKKTKEVIVIAPDDEVVPDRIDPGEEAKQDQDMLKALETASVPKIEADFPVEEEATNDRAGKSNRSYLTTAKSSTIPTLDLQVAVKIAEDSLAIKNCIANFLDDDDRLTYKIVLDIQVLKTGEIRDIKILRSTNPLPELEKCLFTIIRNWRMLNNTEDLQTVQEIKY